MSFDIVIRNGTVVNHDGMFKADVLTAGGKITKVGVISEDEAAGAEEAATQAQSFGCISHIFVCGALCAVMLLVRCAMNSKL